MLKISETEWVTRKVRELLRSCGPKTAKRFLDSRGGPARHEGASREIARHVMAVSQQHKDTSFVGEGNFSSLSSF
jgi:hypothetical protein